LTTQQRFAPDGVSYGLQENMEGPTPALMRVKAPAGGVKMVTGTFL